MRAAANANETLDRLGLAVGEPMPSWGAMLFELDDYAPIARSYWVYLPIALLVVLLLILESFTTEVETHA
jgi:ABC-type dipeptide/oligopeptide/nickel transport system permease subunit